MAAGKRFFALATLLCGLIFALPSLALAAPPSAPSIKRPTFSNDVPSATTEQSLSLPTDARAANGQEYILGTGDKIRLTVYGETDLSGDYEIGSTGIVALPLIGDVQASNLPIRSFEQAVRSKLADGYLHDPRVNAQVINYRPFFILGEVSKPGSYPYVNGMNIVNAVALAGGYTYRADKDDITITRASDPQNKDVPVQEGETVMPGDIIRVPERFF